MCIKVALRRPGDPYHKNGNGTFTDVTEKARLETSGWMSGAGFFDYDKNGKLDLFVCRYLDWNFSKNIYCGSREEGGRSYYHPDNLKSVSIKFHNNGDGTPNDATLPPECEVVQSRNLAKSVTVE